MTDNLCTTDIRVDKVKFTWVINQFTFHVRKAKVLKSSPFSSATNKEFEWILKLGLDKLVPNEKNDISLFLSLSSSSKKVFARYFVTAYGDQHKKLKTVRDTVGTEYNGSITSWGWNCFLQYDQNFKNSLTENKLTIVCEIEFSEMNKESETFKRCKPEDPRCDTLSEGFESLLKNEELVDVKLSVKNKDYPAHKSILAARSPVFAAMFRHKTIENEENRVIIEDIGEDIMDKMLTYIYTGECENVDNMAHELIEAADKYALDGLKIICSEALCKTLTVENASNVLVMADLRGMKDLKDKVIAFVSCNFAEVLDTETWRNILLTYPELVNAVCKGVANRQGCTKMCVLKIKPKKSLFFVLKQFFSLVYNYVFA
ncbi:speckle-type POZ protein B-like [Planococcus citri]|uniref:speckle-type POZ protein B-like n=1 Tax=Planococcus citri TaxID=170843 RepID=UPI0031F938EF